MPIMSENPCANGHPELKLLLEVTSFSDRLPVMHCRRCGENLTYEQAIRNDERLKIAEAIEARCVQLDPGDVWENEGRGYLAEAVEIVRGQVIEP